MAKLPNGSLGGLLSLRQAPSKTPSARFRGFLRCLGFRVLAPSELPLFSHAGFCRELLQSVSSEMRGQRRYRWKMR